MVMITWWLFIGWEGREAFGTVVLTGSCANIAADEKTQFLDWTRTLKAKFCEREMEQMRWQEKLRILKSAVVMLSKVSLGLGGDGGWCWRWWEWILRLNLMQVRQAALLNCLLVVFMGDLNWWESASVFSSSLFLKALYTSHHPSIPNPTQSHQSHFNMAPPGATPSLMKPWNPARSNFYRIKSQVYWGPNFNNFALISTAEQNF